MVDSRVIYYSGRILTLFLVMLMLLSRSSFSLPTYPIPIPFGFATPGISIDSNTGEIARNYNSAQHIAALVIARGDAKAMLIGLGNKVKLNLHALQGNQISTGSTSKVNNFFDGAFGAYTIGSNVIGVLSAASNHFTARSMISTFTGWDIASFMVSVGHTDFSHGSNYPLKARIVPSDSFQAVILVQILGSYEWNKVAIFHSDDQIGLDLHANFIRTVRHTTDHNIEVLHTADFPISKTDFTNEIKAMEAKGATVFLLFMPNEMQAMVLQQGYKMGLFHDYTQTIGVSISTDDPEDGGKDVHQYLPPALAPDILRGHMVMAFDPRLLFKTAAGRQFITRFKAITPTRKESGGLAPIGNTFLTGGCIVSSVSQCTWPSGKKWFMDQCHLFNETNGKFYDDAMDDRSPVNAANGMKLVPGNPGFLYAAVDGNDASIAGNANEGPFFLQNNISYSLTNPAVTVSPKNVLFSGIYNGGSSTGRVGTNWVAGIAKEVPITGTCLGLSQEELNGIPDDGSYGIDWRVLYIYDAMMIVAKYSDAFLKARGEASFTNNDDYVSKLRKYFTEIIPSNKLDGRMTSIQQELRYTGNCSFHTGYEDEDNFALGDRISGHPYSIKNFDASTSSYKRVGFWDPQREVYAPCINGAATVLSTTMECSAQTFRTPDNSVPSDMQPDIHVLIPKPYATVLQFFGSVGLIVVVMSLGIMARFWNNHVLKMRQQYVLVCVLIGALLGCIKVLHAASWMITEVDCNVDYWLTHLSFRIINTSWLFKLWRVHKIFNATGFKRVRITESSILTNILVFVFSCVVVLILSSGLGGPRVKLLSQVNHNQESLTMFCGIPNSIPATVLHGVILIFQGLGLLVTLYYSWKTRNVPPMINEASIIIPQLALTFVVIIVAAVLLFMYEPTPMVYQLVVNLLFALVILFSMLGYFPQVFWALYMHEMKKRNAETTEEDSIRKKAATTFVITEDSTIATDLKANPGSAEFGVRRRRSTVPQGVDLFALHDDLAQEILQLARGSDKKAMMCQEKIVFWKSMMLKLEEMVDGSGNTGSHTGSYNTSSAAVYATNDDDNKDMPIPATQTMHTVDDANLGP